MKKSILLLAAVLGSLVVLSGPCEAYPKVPQSVRDEAARYTQMAKELIASGRVTDGVKVMRLAIQTNPLDPALRMNYVTIMSGKGKQSILDGKRQEAIVIYRSVETELLSAAKLFKDQGDSENAAYALSQVAQIYRYVYQKEGMARAYFTKALELSPNNTQIRSIAQGR